MGLPFSLLLALKYLKPKRSYFSIVTIISILGVLLGVAVLVIVLSVMNGFDEMWRAKILDFEAHLTITGQGPIQEADALVKRIRQVTDVRGVAPFVQGPVVIRRGNDVSTAMLRGVVPAQEREVSQIPDRIVSGRFDVSDNRIVLGSDMARRLGVRVGDTLLLNSPGSFLSAQEIRLPEEATVSGIFDLGMWEFDSGFILCSLENSQDLFDLGQGVHALKVMVKDPYRAQQVAEHIGKVLPSGYMARTWMEQNRQLFGALRVEKNMMFFLLIFITVVAAFGITNTLITVAVQKTREIGLLKAIGFQSGTVMRVFFWQGWIEGMIGTGSGVLVGLLILRYRNDLMLWLSNTFNLELFQKELYHLSEIPASTSAADVAVVAVSVIVICTLAGAIPAYRAARLDPVEALRHE